MGDNRIIVIVMLILSLYVNIIDFSVVIGRNGLEPNIAVLHPIVDITLASLSVLTICATLTIMIY